MTVANTILIWLCISGNGENIDIDVSVNNPLNCLHVIEHLFHALFGQAKALLNDESALHSRQPNR